MAKPGTPALYGVDSRIVACRGDHHPWPQLMPGTVLKGIRLVPQRQGVILAHVDCPVCTRWREKMLLPGEKWRYGGGLDGFSAKPGSERSGLGRNDYVNELNRRLNEGLDWTEVPPADEDGSSAPVPDRVHQPFHGEAM